MAGPGATPRARRLGDSAAGTAPGPAVAHRETRRGRSGVAGQWAAHPSQAVRNATATAATSGPRGLAKDPGGPGGGGGLATCPPPPLWRRRSAPHSSDAGPQPLPRLCSPQQARGTPAHAPLPGARGLALPGLAPLTPSPRSNSRAAAAHQPREIRERPVA